MLAQEKSPSFPHRLLKITAQLWKQKQPGQSGAIPAQPGLSGTAEAAAALALASPGKAL